MIGLRQWILTALITLTGLAFFAGCSTGDTSTLLLATDRPEMAVAVEMFNARQNDYRVKLVFDSHPSRGTYDILFCEYLPSIAMIDQFISLEDLFADGLLEKSRFYQDSLTAGVFDGKQVLLPVSFTLPAMLIRSEAIPEEAGGAVLSLDTILEESRRYNGESTTRFPVMGFSPRWSNDFMYLITRIHNTRIRESTGGTVVWNNQNLDLSLEFIRTWVETINGGSAAENQFRETFLYDPGYKLVFSGRIRFYPAAYQQVLLIPADLRRNVDFRWISDGTRIPVDENMVYAGVVRQPGKRKAALAFMSWFFNEETQESLLESSQFKRIRSFGIVGGFSSLRNVNELILPKYYPGIAGRVPAPGQLDFPPALPVNWNRIKHEVIMPYLQEQAVSRRDDDTLEKRLLTWFSQQAP